MKKRLDFEMLIHIPQRDFPWWYSFPPQSSGLGVIPHIMNPFYGWDDLPIQIAAELEHLG